MEARQVTSHDNQETSENPNSPAQGTSPHSEQAEMGLEEAISLLRKLVKYSAVPGQKHIDMSLALAEELHLYEKAMQVTQTAVMQGQLTRDQLIHRLGLD